MIQNVEKKINFVLVYGANQNYYVRKDGTAAIKVRAYKSGKTKTYNTGIYVLPNQWKNGQIVKHANAVALNQRLRDILTKFEDFQTEQYKKFGKVSLQSLERVITEEEMPSFTAFIKSQLADNNYKKGTRKAHQTTINKLQDCFKRDIFFDEVNYKLLKTFEDFLIGQNLHQNTIHKHFKNIRTHTNEAIRYEYLDSNKNPFLKFKIKRVATQKTPLTETELEILEQWTPPPTQQHLTYIRDFFLISCYTGLRFSDVSSLTASNFIPGQDGLKMKLIAQKTKKPYEINTRLLFRKVGAEKSRLELLLEKYIVWDKVAKDIPLLKYSNQHLNRALKEIFEQIPEINSDLKGKISSHYGRHTCTNILLKYLPLHVVREILQHSDLKTTQTYINTSQDDINRALQNFVIQ